MAETEKWKARAREVVAHIFYHADRDVAEKEVAGALSAAYAEGQEGSWAAGYKAGQASLRAELEWFRASVEVVRALEQIVATLRAGLHAIESTDDGGQSMALYMRYEARQTLALVREACETLSRYPYPGDPEALQDATELEQRGRSE